jgi:hypothetical protein
MKLPTYRRIITQDFPEDNHELVEQLGSNVNDGFNVVYQALNKRLTFQDNIASSVKTVVLTADSTGKPQQTTSFNLDVPNTPVIGCVVLSAQNLTNSVTYPTTTPFISFTQDGNTIYINNITGLQAGQSYRLVVLAIN